MLFVGSINVSLANSKSGTSCARYTAPFLRHLSWERVLELDLYSDLPTALKSLSLTSGTGVRNCQRAPHKDAIRKVMSNGTQWNLNNSRLHGHVFFLRHRLGRPGWVVCWTVTLTGASKDFWAVAPLQVLRAWCLWAAGQLYLPGDQGNIHCRGEPKKCIENLLGYFSSHHCLPSQL